MFLLIVSGLAGILYGLASGNLLSVAMPYLERSMSIGAGRMSTLVASFSLVAVVFGFVAGPLAEAWGRKKVLLLSSVIFIAATPVIVFACGSYAVLFAGLGLQGAAMGLIGTVAPLYLAESLPAEHRGKGTGLFQLFLICGIALSGLIGFAVACWLGAGDAATTVAEKVRAWQTIFALGTIPGLLLLAGSIFIPESPVWLAARRGAAVGTEPSQRSGAGGVWASLKMLADRRFVVPFLIVALIVSCNKLCGLPYVLCYSVKIFQSCGLAGAFANGADLTFKVVMLAGTVLACALVDRKGRKFLLELGTLGIIVSMSAIALAFFAIERGLVAPGGFTGTVVAVAVTAFIGFYSVGPGVCVWLVMTEVLPTRIRAIGMSVILLANHFIAAAQQWTFLPFGERFGYAPMFGFCVVATVAYFLAVRYGMPETKGLPLDAVEAWYRERRGGKAK